MQISDFTIERFKFLNIGSQLHKKGTIRTGKAFTNSLFAHLFSFVTIVTTKGSRKKNYFAIKDLTPPLSSLMAVGTLAVGKKKFLKKSFSLMARPSPPPP